ncbi:MAG: PKD domain-containing protein [Paludibacteraceae bacterium]|nr:PKD domain-containing protein [Paludibacteraceae bacterium]
MSLNLITGTIQKGKYGVAILVSFFTVMSVYSQLDKPNVDTPNLSFENGNFEGWECYTGGFYFDTTDSTYKFENWNQVSGNEMGADNRKHFVIKNNAEDVPDDNLRCYLTSTNPEGKLTARIGSIETAENSGRKSAMAERLVYKFTVTENTTLLTYRYAVVMHCPDLVGAGAAKTEHTGEQYPTFQMNVNLYNPKTGTTSLLQCGNFKVNAAGTNAIALKLTSDEGDCPSSPLHRDRSLYEFAYVPWTYGNFDLSNHVGEEVTIEIINRDCLSLKTGNTGGIGGIGGIGAGGGATETISGGQHRSYGYFWAETKKLELTVKNCIGEDAVFYAPKGFDRYEWKSKNNVNIVVDPTDPSIATIANDLKVPGDEIECIVHNSDDCKSEVRLSAVLDEMTASLDFDFENDCDGLVHFKDIKDNVVGDAVSGYLWDFGNGKTSAQREPDAMYMEPKDYNVKLTIQTELGCTASIEKIVDVRYFPKLNISSESEVCRGDTISLVAIGASDKSIYKWDTGDSTMEIRRKIDASQVFKLEVIDEYLCSYTANFRVSVKESPMLLIKGSDEVCLGDTAALTAIEFGSATGQDVSFVWDIGTTGADMKARPLQDNTVYTVTASYKNGCYTEMSKTIRVNPLPVVSVSGDGLICQNDPANLKADVVSSNGDVTYIWKDLFNGPVRTVYPDTTTVYSVYCVDAKNCVSRPEEFTVKVKELPDVKITGDSAICEGKSTNLTVTGVSSNVVWYDGTIGQTTITRTPTQDTIYWVEGTSNNCKGRAEFKVKLLDVPTVWIEGNTTICQGDTTRLYAKGADTYIWNTSDVTDSIDVHPYSMSDYTVTGTTTNGGCVGTASIRVNVNEPPTINITGDREVCDGDDAQVSVSGAAEYFWSNNAYGPKVTLKITKDDTLTVRCIDDNLCEATAKWTIKKKELPVLSYTGETAVCSGQILTVTASGANTYEWQDGTGTSVFSRVLENDMELKVKGFINGCSSSMIIPVSILPVPSLWVSGSGVTGVCAGDSASLIGHGADYYQWSNGQKADTITIYPSNSTEYSLYGYTEKGCEVMIPVPVKVNPNPMVYTKGDDKACQGTLANIEALDANGETASFSWGTGNIGSIITPMIMSDTSFTVTAENKYGCKGTAVHEVILTELPELSYVGKTTVCYGESTTIQGTGALTYSWNDGANEYSGSSINVTPKSNTVIRMTGSNVSNCPATIDIQIIVQSLPSVFISGDSAVCLGEEFSLYASGADTYKWNTGDETSDITYNTSSTTEYTVYGTNAQGCTSKATKIVQVRPSPMVSIEKGPQSGCPGLPDTIHLSAKGADVYKWSSEPYSASIALNGLTANLAATIDGPTTVTVEGTDVFGCTGTAKVDVDLVPRHDIEFSVSPDFVEEGSSNVRFNGVFPKTAKWYWETGDNMIEETGVNTSHYYDPNAADSFIVKVRAIDQFGCEYTGRSTVYTWLDFWAAEGFTPNGDDLNDTFKFYGGEFVDDFSFIIFNRLGEIVFEGQSINDEWDGTTIDGEKCPWGVYGWYCKYKSNYKGINKEGERRGFVSLIR